VARKRSNTAKRADSSADAGSTSLQRAIEKGDPVAVRKAIAAGASLELLPELKLPPLLWAVTKRKNRRYVEVMDALLSAGAPSRDAHGHRTPLILLAADSGHEQAKTIALLEHLLRRGHVRDLDAHGEHGETALHVAAKNGALAVVKFLVARGADVHVKTKAGDKPSAFARPHHRFLGDEHAAVKQFLLAAEAGDPVAVAPRDVASAARRSRQNRRAISKKFDESLASPAALRSFLSKAGAAARRPRRRPAR